MEPYKLTTDKAPLSDTLGPPGFHPLLPGQCPEDRLTAQLAEHGYRDELPQYGIDDSNDYLFSLFTLLANRAVSSTGGGGAAAALTAAAVSLKKGTLAMLEAAHRQRLQAAQAAAAAASSPGPAGSLMGSTTPSLPPPPPQPPPPPPPPLAPSSSPLPKSLSSPNLRRTTQQEHGGMPYPPPPPPPPLHQQQQEQQQQPNVLYGNPAAALSYAAAHLPELRTASDVGRRLWVSALAGSAPLGYLARTAPSMPDSRRMLLTLLWQCGVPAPRAAWFLRLLYTH
ncbi:hypothetical protein Agub_g11640, partial [Astrephomene gubernaculifera]